MFQSETILRNGSATFTDTWSGKGANGDNENVFTNGTLKYDVSGNLKMIFSWSNGSGATHTFSGVITRLNGFPSTAAYFYGNYWHLDGNVTTATAGDGPGHISGDGGIPFPMAKPRGERDEGRDERIE